MNEEMTIRQNVSFRETDYKIISDMAVKKGLDFSSTVRVIVREWAEQNSSVMKTEQAKHASDRQQGK